MVSFITEGVALVVEEHERRNGDWSNKESLIQMFCMPKL